MEHSYPASVDKAKPCQNPESDGFDMLRPLTSELGVAGRGSAIRAVGDEEATNY